MFEFVDELDGHEDTEGDDEEVDDGLDKRAPLHIDGFDWIARCIDAGFLNHIFETL